MACRRFDYNIHLSLIEIFSAKSASVCPFTLALPRKRKSAPETKNR
jgi:hypothetical protein